MFFGVISISKYSIEMCIWWTQPVLPYFLNTQIEAPGSKFSILHNNGLSCVELIMAYASRIRIWCIFFTVLCAWDSLVTVNHPLKAFSNWALWCTVKSLEESRPSPLTETAWHSQQLNDTANRNVAISDFTRAHTVCPWSMELYSSIKIAYTMHALPVGYSSFMKLQCRCL